MTLYIDCMPMKNDSLVGIDPTNYADWIGPAIMELNEDVAREEKVPHYMLLSFSKEKAAFAMTIQAHAAKGLPPALIVMTGAHGANEALDILIPMATHVVRGIAR